MVMVVVSVVSGAIVVVGSVEALATGTTRRLCTAGVAADSVVVSVVVDGSIVVVVSTDALAKGTMRLR